MLLPKSITPINCEGRLKNRERRIPESFSCFLSISTFKLDEEIKAISMPEKKAENKRQTKIIIIVTEEGSSMYRLKIFYRQR
jgi:hypothetical protein